MVYGLGFSAFSLPLLCCAPFCLGCPLPFPAAHSSKKFSSLLAIPLPPTLTLTPAQPLLYLSSYPHPFFSAIICYALQTLQVPALLPTAAYSYSKLSLPVLSPSRVRRVAFMKSPFLPSPSAPVLTSFVLRCPPSPHCSSPEASTTSSRCSGSPA